MNLNDFIEKVAYGKGAPDMRSCLGLYLTPDVIYVAEAALSGGKAALKNLLKISLTAQHTTKQTSITSLDFLEDTDKIASLIKEPMSKVKWGSSNVVVTLSHHMGLLRYFVMPAIGRQFWKTAVPFEAKKYIPLPFESLSYDFQVGELESAGADAPRLGALVAVCQKRAIAQISGLTRALGLKLGCIEVAPCSALRMWEAMDPQPARTFCQVHFDRGNIRIIIARDGLPVFFRELFLGAEVSIGNLRKLDLSGCIAFVQKQLDVGPLAEVRLSGSGVELSSWRDAITQELGIAVRIQDVAAELGAQEGNWGIYASVGASLRYSAPTRLTLDLAQVGRISEDEFRAARAIFCVSAVLAAWFAAVGLYKSAFSQLQAHELAGYKRDSRIEAAIGNKTPENIESMLKKMQNQVEFMQNIDRPRPKMTLILKDISDSLPPRVWLTKIKVAAPVLSQSGIGSVEMQLEGHASAPSMGEEQDLAFQYKAHLATSPVVGKLFSEIQPSISRSAIPASARLDPNFQRQLEKRTKFTIYAKSGR